MFFVAKKSNWDRSRRAEFYLCGWLAAGLAVYIATAHPTFRRYFIFMVPFVSVAAAPGLYAMGSRLASPARPFWPALFVSTLVTLALARSLFDERDSITWADYKKIAAKVEQVTPRNGMLYGDELVYFLLQRTPPSGLEFSYSHKVELPPAEERLLHIISKKELEAQIKAGRFDTLQTCNDDFIDELDLENLYPHKADIADCTIFWGKISGSRKKAP